MASSRCLEGQCAQAVRVAVLERVPDPAGPGLQGQSLLDLMVGGPGPWENGLSLLRLTLVSPKPAAELEARIQAPAPPPTPPCLS